MKKIYTLSILITLTLLSHAQVTFQKTYGTTLGGQIAQSNMVTATADGGYACLGITPDLGAGGFDFYLVRTDNQGHQLWTKTFGIPSNDVPENMERTADHGFIITGSILRTSGSESHSDLALIKTDSMGDTMWTKLYGQDLTDEIGWYVHQTLDGGYIAVGNWGSSSNTYIIKTNNVGDTLWTRVYNSGIPYSVRQLPDGGYIISGNYYSFNTNGLDFFLMRINKGGNLIWDKDLGLVGTEYQSIVNINSIDSAGFVLTGTNHGYGGSSDRYKAYIIRTDTLGNPVWSRTYGDTHNDIYGVEAIPTSDGYALMCLTSYFGSSYPRLVKINRTGNVQWSKSYNYLGTPRSIEQTADKGYIFSTGYGIFNVTKTDSMGNSGCQQSDTLTTDSIVTTLVYDIPVTSQTGTAVNNPHIAVGNGGGTETTLCLNTAVAASPASLAAVSVYPNPANDNIYINKSSTGTATVIIYNAFGTKVYKDVMNAAGNKTINAKQFADGLYFVTVTMNQQVITTKVIISK